MLNNTFKKYLILLVLDLCGADEVFLVSLAGRISTKTQKCWDINTVHMFCSVSVTAQVKLRQ